MVASLVAAAAGPIAAQAHQFEVNVGIATAQFTDYPGATAGLFSVGAQSLSGAYWLSRRVSVELALLASVSEADSLTDSQLDLALSLPVIFAGDRHKGSYIAPRIAVSRSRYHDGIVTSQLSFGAVVGHELPLTNFLSLRLDVTLSHASADRSVGVIVAPGFTRIAGDGGLSIFF